MKGPNIFIFIIFSHFTHTHFILFSYPQLNFLKEDRA